MSHSPSLAIGQQGSMDDCGNGGTFIAKKVTGIFRPVIVAGGAGGISFQHAEDEPEDLEAAKINYRMMANGKTVEFGGRVSAVNAVQIFSGEKNIRLWFFFILTTR